MLIVGERINASRKAIGEAIHKRDAAAVRDVARKQRAAGADYIDVNAGIFAGREAESLRWLVANVQEATSAPCCLDSTDPGAVEAALAVHEGRAMINSISLERERYEGMLPILAGTDLKVIALCTSDEGLPRTARDRLAIAGKLIDGLVQGGVAPDNIYVDPLVQPVATDVAHGIAFLDAVESIMTEFRGVHTICGLSNVSYGMPHRRLLNRTFLAMAVARGLDAAILDPLDQRMMAGVIGAEALAGRDGYCRDFLKAHREGRLAIEEE